MLFRKVVNRKRITRRRGPAEMLDIGETGATAKFQSQGPEVARYCVRKKVEEKDVEDAELDSPQTRTGSSEAAPWGTALCRGK